VSFVMHRRFVAIQVLSVGTSVVVHARPKAVYHTLRSAYRDGNLIMVRLNGAVAQLGERRVRNAEVEGSSPFRSTSLDNHQFRYAVRPARTSLALIIASFCPSFF
jgi:hypothetical protein